MTIDVGSLSSLWINYRIGSVIEVIIMALQTAITGDVAMQPNGNVGIWRFGLVVSCLLILLLLNLFSATFEVRIHRVDTTNQPDYNGTFHTPDACYMRVSIFMGGGNSRMVDLMENPIWTIWMISGGSPKINGMFTIPSHGWFCHVLPTL